MVVFPHVIPQLLKTGKEATLIVKYSTMLINLCSHKLSYYS